MTAECALRQHRPQVARRQVHAPRHLLAAMGYLPGLSPLPRARRSRCTGFPACCALDYGEHMPSVWQLSAWSPKLSIPAPHPGQKCVSSASRGSPTRIRVRRVHGRDVNLKAPSSAPTKEVMSVARCAAFKVCGARRRSGAFSLKYNSICLSTCSCHHFCFVHAESISAGSIDSAPSIAASVAVFR